MADPLGTLNQAALEDMLVNTLRSMVELLRTWIQAAKATVLVTVLPLMVAPLGTSNQAVPRTPLVFALPRMVDPSGTIMTSCTKDYVCWYLASPKGAVGDMFECCTEVAGQCDIFNPPPGNFLTNDQVQAECR